MLAQSPKGSPLKVVIVFVFTCYRVSLYWLCDAAQVADVILIILLCAFHLDTRERMPEERDSIYLMLGREG